MYYFSLIFSFSYNACKVCTVFEYNAVVQHSKRVWKRSNRHQSRVASPTGIYFIVRKGHKKIKTVQWRLPAEIIALSTSKNKASIKFRGNVILAKVHQIYFHLNDDCVSTVIPWYRTLHWTKFYIRVGTWIVALSMECDNGMLRHSLDTLEGE